MKGGGEGENVEELEVSSSSDGDHHSGVESEDHGNESQLDVEMVAGKDDGSVVADELSSGVTGDDLPPESSRLEDDGEV